MKAVYSGSSIAHPEALARALRVRLNDLKSIAGAASEKYSDFEVDKKDGTKRKVSGPQHDLKLLQKRINRLLFEQVVYPDYVTGGIKERDYVQNARMHSNAQMAIALDIQDFFPRIKRKRVAEIFKHFFRFADPVVEILADLCTKDGVVPQGACTSSYLANLVFYEYEPRLVSSLKDQGFIYSRLIDDITISSKNLVSKVRVEKVRKQVSAMLHVHGFSLKQKKTRVTSASNPEQLMEVTGLWLNRGRPRVKREERIEIRKEVRSCLSQGAIDRTDPTYHDFHERTSGRVGKLTQLGHDQAKLFREQLRSVLPLYNVKGVRKTRGLVAGLIKTPVPSRASPAYIQRFYQIMYRINILARSRPDLATLLRSKMKKCAPRIKMEEAIHG